MGKPGHGNTNAYHKAKTAYRKTSGHFYGILFYLYPVVGLYGARIDYLFSQYIYIVSKLMRAVKISVFLGGSHDVREVLLKGRLERVVAFNSYSFYGPRILGKHLFY